MRKQGWLQRQLQNAADVVDSLPAWMQVEESPQQPTQASQVTPSAGICEVSTVQLLTIEQVAELTQVSARTLRRLHERGKVPPAVRVGRALRWRESDIRKWIERGCR